MDRKLHWETVYETKNPDQVSWTQEIPKNSLDLIRSCNLPKDAKIIDVGGGDSKLVDFLLAEGFTHITVLDISAKALEKAKVRLGTAAEQIKWIVSDISEFEPETMYDLWHDRAVFHFLTADDLIRRYVETANKYVKGHLVVGTFSESGPLKCSGLEICQYSQASLTSVFADSFEKLQCLNDDHQTPFGTIQNFTFCSFKKR